jgi:hypothetical protein
MAAELHGEDPIWTPAIDVYAFAGTCLQARILFLQSTFLALTHLVYRTIFSKILCDEVPSEKQKGHPIVRICQGQKPGRPKSFTDDKFWDFLNRCWEKDPKKRPAIREMAPFLKQS